jgi:hypothetical protein
MNELGLTKDPKGSDLAYQNIMDEFKNQQFWELENPYNSQTFNNEHAIGFDNVEKRA